MTHEPGFRGLCRKLAPVTAALAFALFGNCARAERAVALPAPAIDAPLAAKPGKQTIVFAGGCFWGVQAVFQHVKGVTEATSGYAGGSADTAKYELVSDGDTGHAESVRVTFDPASVSLGQLLRVFFSVAHDPTEVNRQGPDVGTQYRSAIFPQSAAQARVARAYVAQLSRARVFKRPIATRIESGGFAPAEAYHQDFMRKNPNYPYIVINDRPKLGALKKQFPSYWRG